MTEEQISRYNATDWQAITKRFPSSTFDSYKKSWRVLTFEGVEEKHPQLQQTLAAIISRILEKQMSPNGMNYSQKSVSHKDEGSISVLKKIAEDWGLQEEYEQEEKKDEEPIERYTKLVLPNQIKIISPTEAKITLYPRSLRCDHCNYYAVYTDLSKIKSTECPICKKGQLRQVSLLFFCDQCGYQHEITPPFTDPIKDGPTFRCGEEGCTGHLMLDLKRKKLTQSRWVCSHTKNETEVVYFCPTCSDWPNKKPKRMTLQPTTATYLKPLIYSVVQIDGNQTFKIDGLNPIWSLNNSTDDYNTETKETIHDVFGVEDVQVIDNVVSYTVVYGYAPYKEDATIRFFDVRNPDTNQFEYRAYVSRSEGKAALIKFDKAKVAETALEQMKEDLLKTASESALLSETTEQLKKLRENKENADETYAWLSHQTIDILTNTPIAQLKGRVPLFTFLHSLEHALTYQASLRAGLEESAFVGKVLINDCAVLIYEREQVEAGGVEYLAYDLIDRWFNEAMRHVRDCRYQCHDGCVSCLYIRDPLCHPFFPSEVPNAYIFPNSLLNRRMLLRFWGISSLLDKAPT